MSLLGGSGKTLRDFCGLLAHCHLTLGCFKTAPSLLYSKTTNVKQYPLPSGAREGTKAEN